MLFPKLANSSYVGNYHITKGMENIYVWSRTNDDITQFCASCTLYQKVTEKAQLQVAPILSTPFEQVGIRDIARPLPKVQ